MRIDIITLFPKLFGPFLDWSMIKKAQEIGALELGIHNLRNWAIDERGTADSRPYGGGPGMILRPEPIFKSIKATKQQSNKATKVVLLSPKGKTFNQQMAKNLSTQEQLILICGHYEGVDERIRQHMIDKDISIGNFVLSGGELPAMVVTDALSRLLPGVLEKESAAKIESFSQGLKELLTKNGKSKMLNEKLLEYPHYTRPKEFKGWKVPDILLSGNHQKIAQWRAEQISAKPKVKND